MWRDSKQEMLTCICRDALPSPSAVRAKSKLQQMMGSKAVDVKSMYSAIMVGKNEEVNGSQYVSVYYEDPGVPPRLAHMAAAKGLDGYMATFDRELQRRVNERIKMDPINYESIPMPPRTRESLKTQQFTTGRTSVPQSDDENDEDDDESGRESRAGSPELSGALSNEGNTKEFHFAPTNTSREYRFSGRNGMGKRQRIQQRISKLVALMQELADPNSVARRASGIDEDINMTPAVSSSDERPARIVGRKRRWAKRMVFGALVWIGRTRE
jgi:hypothetical protein